MVIGRLPARGAFRRFPLLAYQNARSESLPRQILRQMTAAGGFGARRGRRLRCGDEYLYVVSTALGSRCSAYVYLPRRFDDYFDATPAITGKLDV